MAIIIASIHDPSTGAYISDSILIAEYLEKTYPDTSKVFPHNTLASQDAFLVAFGGNLSALWNFVIPAICSKLSPPRRRVLSPHEGEIVWKGDGRHRSEG